LKKIKKLVVTQMNFTLLLIVRTNEGELIL